MMSNAVNSTPPRNRKVCKAVSPAATADKAAVHRGQVKPVTYSRASAEEGIELLRIDECGIGSDSPSGALASGSPQNSKPYTMRHQAGPMTTDYIFCIFKCLLARCRRSDR